MPCGLHSWASSGNLLPLSEPQFTQQGKKNMITDCSRLIKMKKKSRFCLLLVACILINAISRARKLSLRETISCPQQERGTARLQKRPASPWLDGGRGLQLPASCRSGYTYPPFRVLPTSGRSQPRPFPRQATSTSGFPAVPLPSPSPTQPRQRTHTDTTQRNGISNLLRGDTSLPGV